VEQATGSSTQSNVPRSNPVQAALQIHPDELDRSAFWLCHPVRWMTDPSGSIDIV